jgi:hypothetical protein
MESAENVQIVLDSRGSRPSDINIPRHTEQIGVSRSSRPDADIAGAIRDIIS